MKTPTLVFTGTHTPTGLWRYAAVGILLLACAMAIGTINTTTAESVTVRDPDGRIIEQRHATISGAIEVRDGNGRLMEIWTRRGDTVHVRDSFGNLVRTETVRFSLD